MQLGQVASLLGHARSVASLKDAAQVAAGLRAVTAGGLPVPLFATTPTPTVRLGSQVGHHLSTDSWVCSLQPEPAAGSTAVQFLAADCISPSVPAIYFGVTATL